MDFSRQERVPRIRLEEVRRCSENHYKEREAGNVPLPGTTLISPVKNVVKDSHTLFFLFLMISERNFTPAGKMLIKKITRMYLAGSSFPT
jgi:hypothetical protein